MLLHSVPPCVPPHLPHLWWGPLGQGRPRCADPPPPPHPRGQAPHNLWPMLQATACDKEQHKELHLGMQVHAVHCCHTADGDAYMHHCCTSFIGLHTQLIPAKFDLTTVFDFSRLGLLPTANTPCNTSITMSAQGPTGHKAIALHCKNRSVPRGAMAPRAGAGPLALPRCAKLPAGTLYSPLALFV
jgi:hypothetical protein